ncbi:MAG TPA: cytochrome b [Rhodopseudomonas sp.]|uniref:cytochrome b n=1 Tax=Rhodopseudomonas sp. TaxID=1078 RepID=UPI002ED8A164
MEGTLPAQYGTVAKLLHWSIVALLAIQYPIGWLMPDIHRGQQPGTAMALHVSFGLVILTLMLLRLGWRLGHKVAPEPSLPRWQRVVSEAVHRLLYALVIATTLTGWLFASFRGWSLSFFFVAPLPMLASDNAAAGKFINGWHQALEWTLLVTLALHIGAALLHRFYYRDGVLQRMLPNEG